MQPGVSTKLFILTAVLAISGMGCAHTQQPERRVYIIFDDITRVRFKSASFMSGTGGAGAEAYCNELQKKCHSECWDDKPDLTSIRYHSERHDKYCSEKCLDEFMRCVKEQERLEKEEAASRMDMDPSNFSSIDSAIAWFRRHAPAEPPLGTVIIVGGVEFTLAELAGALVLAP